MRILKFLIVFFVINYTSAQEKPNILMIIVDDFGYHDVSYNGSQIHQTPSIDKLAKNGIVFKNGYSSYPRCTPSRFGMFTGTYPVNENKGYLAGIPKQKNFIHQFNKAGYNTSYVGKWHIGHDESVPKGYGFKHSYGAGESGGTGSFFYPFNKDKNGKPAKYVIPNVEEDSKEGDYLSDVLTDATIDFISSNSKKQPFFAVLAYYAVHTPIEAKKEYEERNKKEIAAFDYGDTPEYIKEGAGRRKMRQDDAAYAGMVENVDMNITRLIKHLEKIGVADNTLIVLTSDHGGLSNDGFKGERHLATTNLPFKAGKGWLYEGGIRVPFILNWKDKIKPTVEKESIVLGMDIIPTLLDVALNKKIEDIDGRSFKKVIEGKENWKNRTVFWHSRKARPHSTGDIKTSVVRSGDFKLVHFFEEGKLELYNLIEDEGELNDVSKEEPQKTIEMLKLLTDWKKEYLVPEKLNILKHQKLKNKQ